MFLEYLQKIPCILKMYDVELHMSNGSIICINKGALCTIDCKDSSIKKAKCKPNFTQEIDFMKINNTNKNLNRGEEPNNFQRTMTIENSVFYIREVNKACCVPLKSITYYVAKK